MSRPVSLLLALLVALGNLTLGAPAASADVPEIWFPVEISDEVNWADTYGDSRGGGRTHKGVDIMSPQMQPVYASVGGWIRRAYGGDDRSCLNGGYCTSYGLLIHSDDGRSYFYLHFNDDTPGRPNGCDHVGGAENAYSPRLVSILEERGTLEPLPQSWDPQDVVRVETGELIGYVGSSGNAGCDVDHVHFETWAGHDFKSANDSSKDNPYPYVQAAFEAGRYWDGLGAIEAAETDRLAGRNRIQTAIAVAQNGFETATIAVIAPAEVHPEALVGAPLAAALGGPVLLHTGVASPDGEMAIDPAVVEELGRLGVTDVVILSAADSIDPQFDDALAEATGLDRDRIQRVAGNDRYQLSSAVAEQIMVLRGWPETAQAEGEQATSLLGLLGGNDDPEPESEPESTPEVISPILALGEHEVESRSWPDALAATTLASAQQIPILLTSPDGLPEATRESLAHDGFGEVRIVGGTGAVSKKVEAEVNNLGHETRRLAGTNRFETALAVAKELLSLGHTVTEVHLATGNNFPDALAAGPVVANKGAILLLVDGTNAEGAQVILDWLRKNEAAIEKVTALGGPKAIAEDVLHAMAVHASWPEDQEAP